MLGTGLPLIGNLHLMNILLYPLVVISGILFLYHTIQQRSRRFTLGNMIPGPPGLPLLGNALDLCTAKSAEEILIKSLKIAKPYDHHGIVKLWVGPRLVVCCNNPDDVEAILGSSVHIDKPGEYGFFKRWFGNGLLISTDAQEVDRPNISPPRLEVVLHVLKSFITQLNTHSNILVERLNKQVGEKSFDVHDYVAESTVDILLDGDGSQSEGMGVSRKEQTSSTFDYAIAVMKMCDIIHSRLVKVWCHLESINNCIGFAREEVKLLETIHKLSSKVFKTKKEEYLRHKLAGVNREIGDLSDVTQAATKGTYFDQSRGLKDDLDDDVVTLAKPSVEGLKLAGEKRNPRKVESLFLTCLCLGYNTSGER
uniref:Cytochrome P450 n=1 Tax=Timema poppense TaxID=170557 RepID=A0A7R9D697_TIMPO|nr:unnamed protein product [Timema poppensis]